MTEQLSFDYLWNIQAEHIDHLNRRGQGWSAVSCIHIDGQQDKRFYLKLQENYFSRNLRHPCRGQLTLVNEHRILSYLAAHGVGTPKIAFFASDAATRRAILMTEELAGYHDLEYYLSQGFFASASQPAGSAQTTLAKTTPRQLYQLLRAIAQQVRKMHQAGVQSRSLYPKHIFIAAATDQASAAAFKIAMIDFEKSRISRWNPLAFVRDLVSLNGRTKSLSVKHRIYFFKAYCAARHLNLSQRWLMRWIAKQSH